MEGIMPLLAGLVYYLIVFVVYIVVIFATVKLGIFLRQRKNAKAAEIAANGGEDIDPAFK